MRKALLPIILLATGAATPASAQQASGPPRVYPEKLGPGATRGVCERYKVRSPETYSCFDAAVVRQRFDFGEAVPAKLALTPFGRIPFDLRRALSLRPDGSYLYNLGFIYTIDPKSRVVTDVVKVEFR